MKSLNANILKYITLINDFISHAISVEQFEAKYLEMVKNDPIIYDNYTYKIIGKLFSDVDAYCGNQKIADYSSNNPFADIDEKELRKRAQKALIELQNSTL